jgi:hypothetical protein
MRHQIFDRFGNCADWYDRDAAAGCCAADQHWCTLWKGAATVRSGELFRRTGDALKLEATVKAQLGPNPQSWKRPRR